MSIDRHINALRASGELTPYVPRSAAKRRAYLTEQALHDLTNPASATNLFKLRGYIENSLTRWTTGGRVHAYKRKPMFLKRLCPPPPEIWEIKVTEPDVQVRLFGRFTCPNTLILTNFHTRDFLRRKGSANWVVAMEICRETWENLFPSHPPFQGSTIHDYVLENCDDFEL